MATIRDDLEVPVEVRGEATAPAVLLVAGTGGSMDFWSEDLCAALVRSGFRVVRFDQRDTGAASVDPVGRPSYVLRDLVEDAALLLESLGIASAHWVGFSQGGWVAQLAAIERSERVASLTLVSTRPCGHGRNDPDLPESAEHLQAFFAQDEPPPPAADLEAWVEYLVEAERAFASRRATFDASSVREAMRRVMSRTRDPMAMIFNHPMADQGRPWRKDLCRIGVPTTVVHGDDDPLFPLANAEVLAREIPHAELRILPDVGHELPRRAEDAVVEAILSTAVRAPHTIGHGAETVLGVGHLDTMPGTELRASPIQGAGLFAVRPFAKGETMGVLDGQEVDPAEHPAVLEALEWNALSPDRLLVRALRTSYGLMNHSERPNVAVDPSGREVVALRDIAEGEEIVIDYFDQPVPDRYLATAEAARLRGSGTGGQ